MLLCSGALWLLPKRNLLRKSNQRGRPLFFLLKKNKEIKRGPLFYWEFSAKRVIILFIPSECP